MAEQRFDGFAAAAPVTPIPSALLRELAPQMTDPAELIVTLYAVAALQRVRRFPRLLAVADLRAERPLVEALASLLPERGVDQALEDGLAAAVARGSLLRAADADDWLALNSADGRRAMAHRAQRTARPKPAPEPRGGSIVQLYEDAIGPLPPSLADELHAAAADYPEQWLEDAFAEAVEMNARNWRYIRTILERWQQEGRDHASTGTSRRQSRRSGYEHLRHR